MRNRFWFVGVLLAVLAWQILARAISSLLLPGPLVVFIRAFHLLTAGRLLADIGATLLRVIIGSSTGYLLGIALAVGLAHSRPVLVLLDPIIQVLRPISPFAWTPLVILLFGLGNVPAVLTILAGVLFPAIVIAYEALRKIDPDLNDIARSFGVAGWTRIRQVELPLIAPALLTAVRVLFGVGWILAVGAEMLAANSGLGFRLMNARYLLDFTELYALLLIIGIVGYLLDLGLRRLETRLSWQ